MSKTAEIDTQERKREVVVVDSTVDEVDVQPNLLNMNNTCLLVALGIDVTRHDCLHNLLLDLRVAFDLWTRGQCQHRHTSARKQTSSNRCRSS